MSLQAHASPSPPSRTEWCDLEVVDWSLFPSRKRELAAQFERACTKGPGFFLLVNHGLEEQRDDMFRLCEESFTTPLEDRQKLDVTKSGVYMGWKPLTGGNEYFNIPKFNAHDRIPLIPLHERRAADIERFSRSSHALCNDLLSVFADVLGFEDERWFDARHDYERKGGDHVRFLRYPPVSELPELPLGSDSVPTRILAHTDFGTLTLLFNQHVAGLQILHPRTQTWQFVRPNPAGIVVNVGDALQAWSAGYLRSSWHRVVAPPEEMGQGGETRYSLVYFSRPNDDQLLYPLSELSPKIAALAPTFRDPRVPVDDGALPPTFGEWMARRAMNLFKPETNANKFNWVAPDEAAKNAAGAKL
ncbi:hypothetical protein DFJ74DRAFT_773124 [Hyaloraphidium curvatum]|nr:hypothetical protein DFJ74DRAFT_773124 [Hyaloraphidium curvatum]